MTKTYAQLAREIAALQASAQKQRAIEAKGAIAKINDLIATYGITAGDLKFASTFATSRPASKAAKGKRSAAVKSAKFSDGQGNQWGGHGPRPAWLREAIAAGRTLESFAVGAAAPAAVAPIPASPAKKVPTRSAASKRIKSRTGSAKGKSNKTSTAEKASPDGIVAAPAEAAASPVKVSRKKVAVKPRAASAVGSASKRAVESPVKKSPARKGGATKPTGASKAARKAAAPKGLAIRKKANPNPAAHQSAIVASQAPSALELVTATAAA
jgi:DNA-binding protein H-NS